MRARAYSVLFSIMLATCAFVAALASQSQQTDTKADPVAFSLLKEAHDKRDTFPASLAKIGADVEINDNGTVLKGTFTYSSSGDSNLYLTGASKTQEDWAKEELLSAFSHRRGGDFAKSDGKYALTLGPDDHSPLGRLVCLNDRMKSTNRVKDGQLTQVNRSMGPQRFTITVMQNKIVDGGKYLPAEFSVTYFDTATGAIKRVDLYSDQFTKVGRAWIPSGRRVVTAEDGGFVTRTFALSNIHLADVASSARR